MDRFILNDLISWKDQPGRMPLLVRGARQVGKSYSIEAFGQTYFQNTVVVNFEFERKYLTCFETLDPHKIINQISLISKQPIESGKTLLFLDEIQECPNAILALRYFKEKMPELHVIGAGSLLEFTLNEPNFRMPVGRIQSLYVKPCSFTEYLIASGYQGLVDHLASLTLGNSIELPIHETLLDCVREYLILGGMPACLQAYLNHKNWQQCQTIQGSLLEYYQKDFGKYGDNLKLELLQSLFDKIPGLVTKKIQYTKIEPGVQSRDLKPPLKALINAGLVTPIYHTSASGLPFSSTVNEKKFKLLFLDVGLLNHQTDLDVHTLLQKHLILLNRGILAEQFVGQELLAYGKCYEAQHLYYWERETPSSTAEIDYLMNVGSRIVPLEVKSGSTGRLKSLKLFMEEKQLNLGVRVSQNQFSFNDNILSVPLYMVHEIPRLVRQFD